MNFPRIYLCSLSRNLAHKWNLTFCGTVFLLTVMWGQWPYLKVSRWCANMFSVQTTLLLFMWLPVGYAELMAELDIRWAQQSKGLKSVMMITALWTHFKGQPLVQVMRMITTMRMKMTAMTVVYPHSGLITGLTSHMVSEATEIETLVQAGASLNPWLLHASQIPSTINTW